MIEEIFRKKQEVAFELRKLDEAIRAIQAICEHDMVPDGHDSHHRYYKCSKCRKEESD